MIKLKHLLEDTKNPMDKESLDFLSDVKSKDPELLTKIRNLIKNKGLEAAANYFASTYVTPDIKKAQEKQSKLDQQRLIAKTEKERFQQIAVDFIKRLNIYENIKNFPEHSKQLLLKINDIIEDYTELQYFNVEFREVYEYSKVIFDVEDYVKKLPLKILQKIEHYYGAHPSIDYTNVIRYQVIREIVPPAYLVIKYHVGQIDTSLHDFSNIKYKELIYKYYLYDNPKTGENSQYILEDINSWEPGNLSTAGLRRFNNDEEFLERLPEILIRFNELQRNIFKIKSIRK